MEYSGLVQKYKLNRPLTEEEKELQLHQKKKLDITPHYQFATIKLNSTFLELADKYYGWRGWLSMGMLIVSGICLWAMGLFGFGTLEAAMDPDSPANTAEMHTAVLFMLLCLGGLLLFAIWGLRKESFHLTHFPARLNRKTRMIHLFRPERNGGILSVPWDKVFFTLGRGQTMGYLDVRGHILAPDGQTVQDTFSLGTPWPDRDQVRRHWEYMRRYMENGPQSILEATLMYLPIANAKESWVFGFFRLWMNAPSLMGLIALGPLFLLINCTGRPFADATSKIPQWPADIEAQCAIEPGDAFERDARKNRYNRWGWPV
jgi:hypothetical protein